MKIYKKCPCCGKIMFLMMGSDFGNEIEFGSAFGSSDNIPHTDTKHETDWECLTRFLTCLSNSHGEVFISLKEQEKKKIPADYQEDILNWTEAGYQKPEEKKENKEPSKKTIQQWYQDKKITETYYNLLISYQFSDNSKIDPDYLFTLLQVSQLLQEINQEQTKQQEQQRKSEAEAEKKAEEIKRKMNDGQDWSNIHEDFHPQLETARKQAQGENLKEQWIKANFTYQQVQEWINIGLKTYEFELASWLRDKKKLTAEQVLNYGNIEQLKKEYDKENIKYFDG